MPARTGGAGGGPQWAKGLEGLLYQLAPVRQEEMALQWQSAPVVQAVDE